MKLRLSHLGIALIALGIGIPLVIAQTSSIRTVKCPVAPTAVISGTIQISNDASYIFNSLNATNLAPLMTKLKSYLKGGCRARVVLSTANEIASYECKTSQIDQGQFQCFLGGDEKVTSFGPRTNTELSNLVLGIIAGYLDNVSLTANGEYADRTGGTFRPAIFASTGSQTGLVQVYAVR